jgi:hypothetical protein
MGLIHQRPKHASDLKCCACAGFEMLHFEDTRWALLPKVCKFADLIRFVVGTDWLPNSNFDECSSCREPHQGARKEFFRAGTNLSTRPCAADSSRSPLPLSTIFAARRSGAACWPSLCVNGTASVNCGDPGILWNLTESY